MQRLGKPTSRTSNMTKTLKSLACLLAGGLAGVAIDASAYTITDPYGTAYNSNDCSTDHCGGDAYDSAGIDVTSVNHRLTFSVFTNFREPNPTAPSIAYGDLFLAVDGVRYVLDTSSAQATGSGTAYRITNATTFITAGQATSSAGRPSQDVLYGSGGTAVGSFDFGVAPALGMLNALTYSILDSAVGITAAGMHSIDVLWAMTCGNDVIDGTVALDALIRPNAVPLPDTIALVLGGALGLAAIRRRASTISAMNLRVGGPK